MQARVDRVLGNVGLFLIVLISLAVRRIWRASRDWRDWTRRPDMRSPFRHRDRSERWLATARPGRSLQSAAGSGEQR